MTDRRDHPRVHQTVSRGRLRERVLPGVGLKPGAPIFMGPEISGKKLDEIQWNSLFT